MLRFNSTARLSTRLIVLTLLGASPFGWADTPQQFLTNYEQTAKAQNPAFAGFSSETGNQFFNNKQGGEWSCASCHTNNPLTTGKHIVTNKIIQPLSPNANSERFTDAAKVEKWFKRNCNDVLKRECTAEEKGHVLSWLLSVK